MKGSPGQDLYLTVNPHQMQALQGRGELFGTPPYACAAPHQLLQLLALDKNPVDCVLTQYSWSI